MSAPQEDWAAVIDDLDDLTAQIILQLQLEDISALENEAREEGNGDQQTALDFFKEELEHHRALRSDTPPPAACTVAEEAAESAEAQISADLTTADTSTVVIFTCEACGDRFDADHCWQTPCGHW